MKRFACFLLSCMLLLCSICLAEPEDIAYIAYGDYGRPLKILFEAIDAGDYFTNSDSDPVFDDYVWEQLLIFQNENGLTETGVFDSETLYYIFDLEYDAYAPETKNLVWIPLHGGVKYHSRSNCTNMLEPRQIPVECAVLLEFDACKRCKPTELD